VKLSITPHTPLQVLETFMALGAWGVRGNHDDSSLRRWHAWHQGQEVLKPSRAWVSQLQPRHIDALESLPYSIALPDYGIIIVRAACCACNSTHASTLVHAHSQGSLSRGTCQSTTCLERCMICCITDRCFLKCTQQRHPKLVAVPCGDWRPVCMCDGILVPPLEHCILG
jgi:hypothetical protein